MACMQHDAALLQTLLLYDVSFSHKTQTLATKLASINSRLQVETVNNTHAEHSCSREWSKLIWCHMQYS